MDIFNNLDAWVFILKILKEKISKLSPGEGSNESDKELNVRNN